MRLSTSLMCPAGEIFSGSVPPMRLMALRTSLANLLMRLDGLRLTVHTMRQLVARLGHPKLVGGQFGRVHATKQIVFIGNRRSARGDSPHPISCCQSPDKPFCRRRKNGSQTCCQRPRWRQWHVQWFKPAPLRVPQQGLQVARPPVFGVVLIGLPQNSFSRRSVHACRSRPAPETRAH